MFDKKNNVSFPLIHSLAIVSVICFIVIVCLLAMGKHRVSCESNLLIYSSGETVKLVDERGVLTICRGQTQLQVKQHTHTRALSVRLRDVILYDDDEGRKKEKLESNLLLIRPVTLDHDEYRFCKSVESIRQCQLLFSKYCAWIEDLRSSFSPGSSGAL